MIAPWTALRQVLETPVPLWKMLAVGLGWILADAMLNRIAEWRAERKELARWRNRRW